MPKCQCTVLNIYFEWEEIAEMDVKWEQKMCEEHASLLYKFI